MVQIGAWLKRAVLVVVAIAGIFIMFWAILYKVFAPFTPAWLDKLTLIAIVLALGVTWAIDRAARKPATADDKDIKTLEGAPDVAVQLSPEHLQAGVPNDHD